MAQLTAAASAAGAAAAACRYSQTKESSVPVISLRRLPAHPMSHHRPHSTAHRKSHPKPAASSSSLAVHTLQSPASVLVPTSIHSPAVHRKSHPKTEAFSRFPALHTNRQASARVSTAASLQPSVQHSATAYRYTSPATAPMQVPAGLAHSSPNPLSAHPPPDAHTCTPAKTMTYSRMAAVARRLAGE